MSGVAPPEGPESDHPTATQSMTAAQETLYNSPSPLGVVSRVQVASPSFVVTMTALTPPIAPDGYAPTATQSLTEPQAMLVSPVTPLGADWVDQEPPPSLERRM